MPNQGQSHHHIVHHDPAHFQPEQQPLQTNQKKKQLLVLATAGLILIISGLVLLYFNKDRILSDRNTQSQPAPFTLDDTVIMTVGAENIYAEDVRYEQNFYSESQRAELEQSIKDRLINESIILQAGAAADFIELNEEVFNSVYKDREKRRQLIQQVTEQINNNAIHKSGSVVAVWFMNVRPGPLGYDAGKEFAFEKINAAYQSVKSGQMTIQQAGETLKKDTSLAQVDPTSYEANALLDFDTRQSIQIIFDPEFNQALLDLNEGELTDITVVQDYELNDDQLPKKDAVYMFGQVTSARIEGNPPFEAWLAEQKNNYAVTEQ